MTLICVMPYMTGSITGLFSGIFMPCRSSTVNHRPERSPPYRFRISPYISRVDSAFGAEEFLKGSTCTACISCGEAVFAFIYRITLLLSVFIQRTGKEGEFFN